MARTLANAGKSKEQQEKIHIAMFAKIMGPTVEIAVVDKPAPDNSKTPSPSADKETAANKATAQRRRIPSSMATELSNPPGKVGALPV